MITAPNGRTLQEAQDEVQRELEVRARCYPRWIQDKRLSVSDAKDRGERIEAAAHFLAQAAKFLPDVEEKPTV